MAEEKKITIEIIRKKDAEDFTKSLADPDSRAETGSGTAMTAAIAAAFLLRAAEAEELTEENRERLEYLRRNAEIMRKYMVQLIDEDVKCRGPLRRAKKEGDDRKIEAASQSASVICAEIAAMMGKCLELIESMTELAGEDQRHWLCESAELAMAAIKASMRYCINWGDKSSDETLRYVVRRENELQLQEYTKTYASVLKKLAL